MLNAPTCAAFLAGNCPDLQCPKPHDFKRCSCDLVVDARQYRTHLDGNRHKLLMSRKHVANPVPSTRTPRRSNAVKGVPAEERKRRREQHEAFVAFYTEAQADKDNITVSAPKGVDFGVVEAGEEDRHVQVIIRKIDKDARIVIHKVRFTSSSTDPARGKWFSAELVGQTRWIFGKRVIRLKFHPVSTGLFEDSLELVFRDTVLKKEFVIVRSIAGTLGSREDHEVLKASAPYAPRQRIWVQEPGRVIPAGRPPAWSASESRVSLGEYEAPRDVIEAAYAEDGKPSMSTKEFRERFMPEEFNLKSYWRAFGVPLFIEEEKMRQDLDAYSMQGVTMTADHPRYKLEVKGLSEGRPSVLVGDFILVKHSNSTEDTWYEGRVHFVYATSVSLHFGDSFSMFKGTKFDVRFKLNRLPHRRMHYALSRCHGGHARLLFPSPNHASRMTMPTPDQLKAIVPFNRLVGSNPEQLSTVASILHLPPGSPPFIVFGPPGTGKTVTIVEAIRQLLHQNPQAKILVCTPSNSAADLVATKLATLSPTQLFRLNSLSRQFSALPELLHPFSLYNSEKVFAIPPRDDLAQFRVVVSTCISGAVPSGLGLKRGHFSHVFIDEAGQAKEPEAMIPILTMGDERTNVVLAGDNQQLGPVLHSPLAGALGLKVSYLARLMERELYDLGTGEGPKGWNFKPAGTGARGGGRGISIVKLVKNFRSHPSILKFPNGQFYNDELQACGDVVITHSLERIDELPKKGFPLIFHGLVGKDQREGNSPSFFNAEEASQVKDYCIELTSRGRKNRVDPKDIGVITPYHMQRCKIGTLLAKAGKGRLGDIKVGSVEEFQGQERKVIIVSTVRSSGDNVMADIRRNLGFVAEPRRFNVAITRARSLLIVIGNPQILALDPLWQAFMNYVHVGGGWRGRQIVGWNPTEAAGNPTGAGNPTDAAGEVSRRVAKEQEEMMARIRGLITRVERSDGFWVEEEEAYPEGAEQEEDEFVPERGTFAREDE